MIRKSVVSLTLLLIVGPLLADKALDDRMMHSASILQEIRGSLDEEAPGMLNDAYAVAIFPEFVKVGLLGAVKHGRGVLATRLDNGDWSKPAFVRLTSGGLGLQFGVSMSQLLIVFKDPKAVDAISGGQFTIGAHAGYAAGELGGAAGAGTDNKFQNQIVAMARSKGLFAGVGLEGGVLRIERDSNVEFYNNAIGLDGRRLLEDTEVEMPAVAQHFRIVLQESVPPLSEEEESFSADSYSAGASVQPNAANGGAMASTGTLNGQPNVANGGATAPTGTLNGQPNAASGGAAAPTGTLNGQPIASASPAPKQREVAEGMWITPENQASPEKQASPPGNSGGSKSTYSSGDSGLAGKLAGKASSALWNGAVELAGNALRDNRDVRNAKLAAKAGSKLAETALRSGSPSAKPAARGSAAPKASPANSAGQWINVDQAPQQLSSKLPQQAAQPVMRAPRGLAGPPRNIIRPRSLITGPPSPSEWPEEWLQRQAANEACVQGS